MGFGLLRSVPGWMANPAGLRARLPFLDVPALRVLVVCQRVMGALCIWHSSWYLEGDEQAMERAAPAIR